MKFPGPTRQKEKLGLVGDLTHLAPSKSGWTIAEDGPEVLNGPHRWAPQDCLLEDLWRRILVGVDVMRDQTGRDKNLALMWYVEIRRAQKDRATRVLQPFGATRNPAKLAAMKASSHIWLPGSRSKSRSAPTNTSPIGPTRKAPLVRGNRPQSTAGAPSA